MAFMKKLACGASLAALAAFAAPVAAVHAQETASEVRGSIVDASGQPLVGARVTIRHEPTGSVSTATTGSTGQFRQSGLRVGGPYTVTATASGFETSSAEDLRFQPGSQPPLSFTLQQAGATEVIQVSGRSISRLGLNGGVGSAFNASDVANQPSLSRDVISTLSRDPLAISGGPNNLSVAGVNPRFNGVTIDGARQQDNFGLGSNTFATSRSPINIDIIESVSLVASDYSVTSGGFTGGLVNVTTKGGSNEIDGSAFYFYRDQDFIGDETFGGEGEFNPGEFEEEEYGLSISGPIIRDKLFFSLSYDEYQTAEQIDFSGSDANSSVDSGLFDALNTLVQDNLGVDMGGRPTQTAVPEETKRYFARFDWNINADHRAQFNYQLTEDNGTSNIGSGNFTSAWYDTPTELENYTVQLFSDWTDNFSTTLRGSFIDFVRGQNCRAEDGLGQLEFRLNDEDIAGTPLDGLINTGQSRTFRGGCDIFRHANEFEDSRIQLYAEGTYTAGDLTHTFGGEYENYDVFNVFVDTSRGNFIFDSVEDIIDGTADVNYRNVVSNNSDDGAAEWAYDRWTAFGQTRWQAMSNLELAAGFRYEYYAQDDVPTLDPTFAQDVGIENTTNLDGKSLFMPRLSFRLDATDRTRVTGGIGRFSGGSPEVWISNAFQAPTVFASGQDFMNVNPSQVPQSLIDQVAAGTPVSIDAIDPDFNIPSDWKASVRVDQEFDVALGGFDLGRDYVFSAQAIYTQSEDTFLWRNLSQLNNSDALPTGVAPDGRTIYADLQDLGIANRTMVTNGSGDESLTLTASLSKTYENGLDFFVSYAHQDVELISEGNSSRGISSWRGQTAVDRNFPAARISPYQVEHAFKVSLGYERDFIRDLTSRIDVFGTVTSGSPYTLTYDVDPDNSLHGRAGGGESPFDNNPLYIPTAPNDPAVVYASGFDVDGFFAFADSVGAQRGAIHRENSLTSAWQQRWDLRLQQDLPGIPGVDRFVGDNNFKLVLDVQNFLNLLNSDWGTNLNGPGFNQSPQVAADLVSAEDVALNGVDGATALTGDAMRTTCQSQGDCVYRYNEFQNRDLNFRDNADSVWYARVGIKYEF